MEKEISILEGLIVDVLHPYMDVSKKFDRKKLVYCEVTLKLRTAQEIEGIIDKLNLLSKLKIR